MAKMLPTTSIQVESIVFPPSSKPPGATTTLVLGGAGVRGMEIQNKFVKLTGLGVYLEEKAIPSLATKWKGKSAEELENSIQFYTDIVTGPFEKHIQVTMIVPISGKQYSEKVSETCVRFWKANGTYTDEDAKDIDKFLELFKDQNFTPGSSILLTVSTAGSLMIGFSKDGIIPESANAVFENEKLGQAVIEMVIGKHGVSPATKTSLASNVSNLIN